MGRKELQREIRRRTGNVKILRIISASGAGYSGFGNQKRCARREDTKLYDIIIVVGGRNDAWGARASIRNASAKLRDTCRDYISMAALSRGTSAVIISRSCAAACEVSETGDDVCGVQTLAYSVLGGMGDSAPPDVSEYDNDFAEERIADVIRRWLWTTSWQR